jgi:hypothetical protein
LTRTDYFVDFGGCEKIELLDVAGTADSRFRPPLCQLRAGNCSNFLTPLTIPTASPLSNDPLSPATMITTTGCLLFHGDLHKALCRIDLAQLFKDRFPA